MFALGDQARDEKALHEAEAVAHQYETFALEKNKELQDLLRWNAGKALECLRWYFRRIS